MKLWEVTNGYVGNGYVRVLVIAKTEKRAKELASEKFKEEAKDVHALWLYEEYGIGEGNVQYRHPEKYWEVLNAEMLADDTSLEYAGEVSD